MMENPDPPSKRARITLEKETVNDPPPHAEEKEEPEVRLPGPPIVIDHCNQSILFEVRASEIKRGLEKHLPEREVKVVIGSVNRDGYGYFEVREEGGRIFLAVLRLINPFTRLKNLNVDWVVNDIVKKTRSGGGS